VEYKIDDLEKNIASEPTIAYGRSVLLDTSELIKYARNGISMKYISNLATTLALTLQDIGNILHVSLRTLQRYEPTKILDSDASSKILNLKALQIHGLEVFGSEEHFNVWLRSEIPSLGHQTPLSYLDTPFGFQLVDDTLGKIDHGIFA
jgi:putative toxin-antitoxin system antitoxin component (TIGR02293 family)